MNKIIIPRKDHEVYFLPRPESVKNNKQLQQYIYGQMEKLHPAFSVKSKTDIRQININSTHWLMVTVMEEEILAEYRILNKNILLFTNTSIRVHKKDFVHEGIHTIDDEKIGFDPEKKEPISEPLDAKENTGVQKLKNELNTVSMRHAVFSKKSALWIIPVISACLLIIFIVQIAPLMNSSEKNYNQIAEEIPLQPQVLDQQIEIITPKIFMPPSIEILASMAVDVVNARGKILHWQCNEDIDPLMVIQLQGIDVLNVYRIFNGYKYAELRDIQEIRYGDNEPYITVFLNTNKIGYAALPAMAFPMHDLTLAMITELSRAFKNNDISIISETLPAAGNGYLLYSIDYSAIDWNLIRSLEIISSICTSYRLQVKNLDINISNNIFYASCTLSYCDAENFRDTLLGNEKYYIPLAFGYIREESVPEELSIEPVMEYAEPIIGSIMDGSGKITFYRDTVNGKIQVRVDND
jgi:hypothetical protein